MTDDEYCEYLASLARAVDCIVRSELENLKIEYDKLSVRILDIKTVGVMGDDRTYEYPVMIDVYVQGKLLLDYDMMDKIGTRIPNDVKGINRVVWTTAVKN